MLRLEQNKGQKSFSLLFSAAQSEFSLNQSGKHNLSLCQGLSRLLLSSVESVMTVKRSSPGKGSMLYHAIFGSAFKTSAVTPSFLSAAFSACTAECPGTTGMKAARCAVGGRRSVVGHAGSNKLSQVWLKMVKLLLYRVNTEAALNAMTGVCCIFFLSLRTQHVNSFGLGGFAFL